MDSLPSVLVIAGFGIQVDGKPRVSKIESHLQPMADTAEEVAYICSGPTSERTERITYYQVKSSRFKIIELMRQLIIAIKLSIKYDYDVVISFSLIPYGIFALIIKFLTKTPAHLGIIGMDLDVHAKKWYRPAIIWFFSKFDIITVAGSDYKDRLVSHGIQPNKIYSVLHPVGEKFSQANVKAEPDYDLLWLTRVSEEKDPLLFVEILSELKERSVDYSAAIAGSGPLEEKVQSAITENNIQQQVDLVGWVEDPIKYYQIARVYILTSSREMLPLTLVEAMSVGVPSIAPKIGGIPDIIEDGDNGFIIDERSVEKYADKIEYLILNDKTRSKMSTNAKDINETISRKSVAETWNKIFEDVVHNK